MKIQIYEGALHDLPSITDIESDQFPDPWTAGVFREIIDHDNQTLYAAKNGEQVVGYIAVWILEDELHILNICVAGPYQRQGIGSQLLIHALGLKRDQEIETIFLEVRHSNDAALKLYEKFGFEVLYRRKNYYASGADALVMRLKR